MTYAQALYIKKMPHLKMARDLANLCKCDLHYKIKVDKRWRLIVYTIIDSDRWFQLALIYRRISISIEQMFWIRTGERFSKCKMTFRIIYYFFQPPSIIKKKYRTKTCHATNCIFSTCNLHFQMILPQYIFSRTNLMYI